MHANNLVINNSATRETVEGIAKLLPHLDREAAAAFVIKAINPIDSGAFVVSSQEEKVFWVLDFVGKEQTNHL